MDGFKKFLLRGNVVDLAVAVVIGAAFGAIVTAVVSGVITPLLGLFGNQNFDQLTACLKGPCGVGADGAPTGVQLLYGSVLTALINFLIIAAVVFFLVVKPVQRLMDRYRTEPEPAAPVKSCTECLSKIPAEARRCAFCTTEQLGVVGA